MRYSELDYYIAKNKLLKEVPKEAGIYAITVDDCIVYVGMSKDMRQRCSQHIYNTQNAMLNEEHKYLLLLAANLGGHKIDCMVLEFCDEEYLRKREAEYISLLEPILNIAMPGSRKDISDLKIDDLLVYINNIKNIKGE